MFRVNIIPRNIYANFLPINAVSGSSFTLIKFWITDKMVSFKYLIESLKRKILNEK